MIRECSWHPVYFGFPLIMGEVEPLEDMTRTSGACPDCLSIQLAEIEAHNEANDVQGKVQDV